MSGRNHRARHLSLALLTAIGSIGLAIAGGVGIVSTTLTDNGDADGFADTRETVELRLTVQNTSGMALTNVSAVLIADDPAMACVSGDTIDVGNLGIGEIKFVDDPFVFTVGEADRATLGLGPYDDLSTSLTVIVHTDQGDLPAHPSAIVLDLDLDVAGGGGPASFFESFESQTFGAFEVDNLDAGLHSLEDADGYRCQYSDPDWVNSNSYGHPFVADECFLGVSDLQADAVFWNMSGPSFSPLGGRGFTGFHSAFFGIDHGEPNKWTTPASVMEGLKTTDPIHLGYDGASPVLHFKHQVSVIDYRTASLDYLKAYDRVVLMAQVADGAGNPVGPWIKLEPYQNVYTATNDPWIFQCTFDPIDDGSTEDDFFDPSDPDRRYGPSSTCYPALNWTFVGETSNPFDATSVGEVDGPGLQGLWGIGTWVESRIDLSRFRGRSIRLRYLYSAIQTGLGGSGEWVDIFNLADDPGDDGWWIDDVTVEDALTAATVVTIDTTDNSGLPDPPGGDSDLDEISDSCDNCMLTQNTDQADQDFDQIGDVCDDCPADPTNTDPDGDLVCADLDNCPFDDNPAQIDVDADGAGSPCDCNDADSTVFPGAEEINDGQDNQCPGDAGHGVADEITGTAGFFNPVDPNEFSWPAQPLAQRYQAVRANTPDLVAGCTLVPPLATSNTFFSDPAIPPPGGGIFYYLAHTVLPNVGSWGQDSNGVERVPVCD